MTDRGSMPSLRRVQFLLWGLALGALAVFAGVTWMRPAAKAPEPVAIGAPFTLTDHTGARVADTSFDGRLRVVYFGFTHCPDVCPTSLIMIAAAMKKLGPKAAEFQPLFITLDPERDTPEVMAGYVGDILPGMVGLTGTPEEIAAVARAYKVGYWKVEDPNSIMPYTVDHASIVFLMDRQGDYVAHFAHGVTAEELAKAMEAALAQ